MQSTACGNVVHLDLNLKLITQTFPSPGTPFSSLIFPETTVSTNDCNSADLHIQGVAAAWSAILLG